MLLLLLISLPGIAAHRFPLPPPPPPYHTHTQPYFAVCSKVMSAAATVEEKTGHVMKEAGEKLEDDGRATRTYYRGAEKKEDNKGPCNIM